MIFAGDGARGNNEIVVPYFALLASATYNGIALGAIDLAKKHVTQKRHADVGLRVSDYPLIQVSNKIQMWFELHSWSNYCNTKQKLIDV